MGIDPWIRLHFCSFVTNFWRDIRSYWTRLTPLHCSSEEYEFSIELSNEISQPDNGAGGTIWRAELLKDAWYTSLDKNKIRFIVEFYLAKMRREVSCNIFQYTVFRI